MRQLLIFGVLIGLFACVKQQQSRTGLEGTQLPSFNLLLMDSTNRFSTDSLPEGKPVVLFYFSPDCPYCKAQTEAILANIYSLKNIQFCILTYASFSETKNYYERYELEKYPNIIVGQDCDTFFGRHFNATQVPYLAIYDDKKLLKQIVIGKVSADDIKAVLN
ncbi:TlpA family protein disulfide reductase [Chitinophaga japonensis]|uniref:Thioredoxin-like protein n=1 Tax=Chitinophaga japonensis TaxID=104662 RepID=A0A562T3Y6_CHIJA|nr:redoxin family protein [Chitinophaga japonensis]TWI87776.1 thioredoxin-like protein [Chitinophaga japonensis]